MIFFLNISALLFYSPKLYTYCGLQGPPWLDSTSFWPQLPLAILYPPPCPYYSTNMSNKSLLQSLYTCCSFHLEWFSLIYLHISHRFLKVSFFSSGVIPTSSDPPLTVFCFEFFSQAYFTYVMTFAADIYFAQCQFLNKNNLTTGCLHWLRFKWEESNINLFSSRADLSPAWTGCSTSICWLWFDGLGLQERTKCTTTAKNYYCQLIKFIFII